MGILMVATWQSAYNRWDDWANCPTRCIPVGRNNLGSQPLKWAIASTYFFDHTVLVLHNKCWRKDLGTRQSPRSRTRRANERVETCLKGYPVVLIMYKGLWGFALGWRYHNFSEFVELTEMMAWFYPNCY
jgi:hypothetical protein